MHVVRHRAAERNELGARGDGGKPASRNGDLDELVEGEPGLDPHPAALPVSLDESVEPVHQDQAPVVVEADIAVGSAAAVDGQGAAVGRELVHHLVGKKTGASKVTSA